MYIIKLIPIIETTLLVTEIVTKKVNPIAIASRHTYMNHIMVHELKTDLAREIIGCPSYTCTSV